MAPSLKEAPELERAAPEGPAAATSVDASHGRRARLAQRTRGARLYASVSAFVVLLAVLVLLAAANTDRARVDWLVGSTRASLVWIVLAASVFGWVLGLMTAGIVRHRIHRSG